MASFQNPITQFSTLIGGANKAIVSSAIGTVGQIWTSNGAGVAPTFQTPAIFTYISATINFKTVGNTTVFTTQAGLKFVVIQLSLICDAASAANADAGINLGTNAASFDNWASGLTSGISVANTYTSFTAGSSAVAIFAASTAVVLRVASADTGTSITGRAVITGFYIP